MRGTVGREVREVIRFVAYGLPKPQGSKRHVGHGVMVESSAVKPWRATISAAAAGAIAPGNGIARGPLRVRYAFFFPRPKAHFTKRGMRPDAPSHAIGAQGDLEKLIRAVNDAIAGVVFADDKQVAEIAEGTGKFYGEPARVEVEVEEL